jgi:signal transduction histidine kinase
MMLSATRLRKFLEKEEAGGKVMRIVAQLETSISTLSETVNHASRMIREPRLQLEETDMNEALEEAVALMETRAAVQGVAVIRDYADRMERIKADRNCLMRAFLNLIANALDAMPSSGFLRLTTGVSDDQFAEAAISDTGPGIRPDETAALFKPFASRKPGGTGLGLAVVQKIVKLHSGTVSLRPAAGGGTEAVVRIPLASGKDSKGEVSIVRGE